jgi:hypothetical protein
MQLGNELCEVSLNYMWLFIVMYMRAAGLPLLLLFIIIIRVVDWPLFLTNSKQNQTEANCVAGLAVLHVKPRQLSTTDILALATMKNAAKCDT